MGIQTFWLEPSEESLVGLRRYHTGSGWTCEEGYHSALHFTTVVPSEHKIFNGREVRKNVAPDPPHDDPMWPTICRCGYVFVEEDYWQPWEETLWIRTDTGEKRRLRSAATADEDVIGIPCAEPGACWNADWMPDNWKGEDGIALMVRLPDNHDWHVDSRASNCTMKDDKVHKCWVRHGDPRECRVTVDKNGVTCQAGAGSIQSPTWHGFLRDGQLVE